MNKKQLMRISTFLAGGVPKFIRIYDNKNTPQESLDNFTCVFTGNYRKQTGGVFVYMCMNSVPYAPCGICQHGESHTQIDVQGKAWGGPSIGKSCHLGKRIPFQELPKDCQHVILSDYALLWGLSLETIQPLLDALRPQKGEIKPQNPFAPGTTPLK